MHLKLEKHKERNLVLPRGSDPMLCCDCLSLQVLHHPVQAKLTMHRPYVTCPLEQPWLVWLVSRWNLVPYSRCRRLTARLLLLLLWAHMRGTARNLSVDIHNFRVR